LLQAVPGGAVIGGLLLHFAGTQQLLDFAIPLAIPGHEFCELVEPEDK